MGRKGSWFSSVRKVFVSDCRKDQKQYRSKLACFGHHGDRELESEGAAIAAVPSLPPRKQIKPIEAENEQNKQAFSLVLATAVAAGAAVAAAAEVARLKGVSPDPGKAKEEKAAIKIQTAFRGYLARRSLRGLRGLARLRALIQGQSVKRQAATTLHCMQTLSRLQSQVRARRIRMSEENQSLQQQLQQKREKELDKLQATQKEEWDVSKQTKEQIEAKLLRRQVAAMRREKALAYAQSHQQTWKSPSKPANDTSMDPNNPHWGWNWLERWMAGRPWEGQSTVHQHDHAPAKSAASHTMSVGEITKLYTSRDQNQDSKTSPAGIKARSPCSQKSSSLTSPKGKAKPSTPRVSSWGGDEDSRKSMVGIQEERNRRHSIAASAVRDDDCQSLPSSPAFSSHTSSTKVAKARSKVQSLSFGAHSNRTHVKGAADSAKKRLSFPASPTPSRRHSVPIKLGMVPNKNVAAFPEEKMKLRKGGSR